MFWLDGTSKGTADQGYIEIGRKCGKFQLKVEDVKSWLACNSQRWLLIIDNADDLEIDYSQYIPRTKRGDVLLTTRNPECGVHNTVGSENLQDLEPDLAQELLLRASGVAQSLWTEKKKAALDIVKCLASHTLAIIQAGAFIRQKLCSLEQYPVIFQQEKGHLLRFHSTQNTSVYRNVYTTFEVSANHLEKSELPEASDALGLLHILAFMHNSGIPETMFQRAIEYASQLKDTDLHYKEEALSLFKSHVTRLPEYVKGQISLQNHLRWRKACSSLESLSIITLHAEDGSITISAHPLVHAWAKERQDFESQRTAWQSASTIIAFSCQGHYNYHPFFVLLQPHVRACANHDTNGYTQQLSDLETAQILLQLAYVLYRVRDDRSLNMLVQQMRSRLQSTFAANEGVILEVAKFTGRIYKQQGRYGEVVQIYENITKRQSLRLADDHPSRLASQHALACAYQANGQIKEAVQLLKHVVKTREKLADDHPNRLASQHALARAYQTSGHVKEAVQLLEHVVKTRGKLANDHPSRLASQHVLAGAYQANGQVKEAVQLLEYIVKIKEKLANDHPSRLASQHALACAYQADGQVKEAVRLLEYVFKIEEKLADDHPDRVASQYALACAYQASGQAEKALQLLEHVIKIGEKAG